MPFPLVELDAAIEKLEQNLHSIAQWCCENHFLGTRQMLSSKMLYCSSVWSNTRLQNIKRLQSIQNFASKIVTNSRKFDHVTPLLRELNWLPVKEQLFYRDSVLTF
ncbi:unnamed protein product [Porites lobata]|uniref:Uncharacterized protein n=1 Tax=Porites lobata TaxID=104759 RepID=A0ABN8NUC1_9CNID|nr:unnamed protein product [Porites lobata]